MAYVTGPKILRGSFSAVSTPVFASKHSLELGSRWKALDEIYKIYMCVFGILLHRSDLQNSATFVKHFAISAGISLEVLQNVYQMCCFRANLDEHLSDFHRTEFVDIS